MASAGCGRAPTWKGYCGFSQLAEVLAARGPRQDQPVGSVESKQGEFLFLVCLAPAFGHQESVRRLGLPRQQPGGCI